MRNAPQKHQYKARFVGLPGNPGLTCTVKAFDESEAASKALSLAGARYAMVDLKRAN